MHKNNESYNNNNINKKNERQTIFCMCISESSSEFYVSGVTDCCFFFTNRVEKKTPTNYLCMHHILFAIQWLMEKDIHRRPAVIHLLISICLCLDFVIGAELESKSWLELDETGTRTTSGTERFKEFQCHFDLFVRDEKLRTLDTFR